MANETKGADFTYRLWRYNGAPGERPYHPGYYAAFALDPDGNNIEVVFHGPATYSADSVKVTFEG